VFSFPVASSPRFPAFINHCFHSISSSQLLPPLARSCQLSFVVKSLLSQALPHRSHRGFFTFPIIFIYALSLTILLRALWPSADALRYSIAYMSSEHDLVQLGRGVMDSLLVSSDVSVLFLYSLGGLRRSGMLDRCIAAFGGCTRHSIVCKLIEHGLVQLGRGCDGLAVDV
jgi:hypothetical protein